jgi:HPt (histidine-containing phosphotransfer) domain-containing protein
MRAQHAPEDEARASSLPVVDCQLLIDLERSLPFFKLKELVLRHLIEVELHLIAITEARAKGDLQGVSKKAHAIADICGKWGAVRTSIAARDLESACQSGEKARTYETISALADACAISSDAIRAWLNGRPDEQKFAVAS